MVVRLDAAPELILDTLEIKLSVEYSASFRMYRDQIGQESMHWVVAKNRQQL